MTAIKKPSFGKLRTASMHFGPSGNGTPYISDGDSARVLFFFNLSGAYNGYARIDEAKYDARYIVRAVNNHEALIAAMERAANMLPANAACGVLRAAIRKAREE